MSPANSSSNSDTGTSGLRAGARRACCSPRLGAFACVPATALALPPAAHPVSARLRASRIGRVPVLPRMRVYSYSYRFRLGRTKILVSPYADMREPDRQPLMTHAKVYVVDDEVAFLGSLNLTTEGFFDNFESCVRIEDPVTVREMLDTVETSLPRLGGGPRGAYPGAGVVSRACELRPSMRFDHPQPCVQRAVS